MIAPVGAVRVNPGRDSERVIAIALAIETGHVSALHISFAVEACGLTHTAGMNARFTVLEPKWARRSHRVHETLRIEIAIEGIVRNQPVRGTPVHGL